MELAGFFYDLRESLFRPAQRHVIFHIFSFETEKGGGQAGSSYQHSGACCGKENA